MASASTLHTLPQSFSSTPPGARGAIDRFPAVAPGDLTDHQLAQFLGYFSLGLGAAEVAAPQAVARAIGVGHDDGWLPLLGIREVISGAGILAQRRPAGFLWSRVAGDLMDLAYLGAASLNPRNDRTRLAMAMAAVAGVTFLDMVTAERHSRRPKALRNRPRPSGEICIRKHITINRSPEELYAYWHRFENLPKFMYHLKSVETKGSRQSHWIANAPLSRSVEWDAETTEEVPGRLIAWRSTGGNIENSGSVRFEPAPGDRGTEMQVELIYRPPGGALGVSLAWLFGENPDFQVQEDLRRFKQVMETGEFPTTEGQPSGRGRSWIPGL